MSETESVLPVTVSPAGSLRRRRRGRPPKVRSAPLSASQSDDRSPIVVQRQAPDIAVSERRLEPQEALYEGNLDDAQTLIDRRLERGVFDYASAPIRFNNPEFVGRWFNEAVNGQQIYRARQRGWLPVTPDMIADLEQLGLYGTSAAGYVVRGQRGEEHLMFMTQANRQRIAAHKTAENAKRMGSTAKVKSDLASAAGQNLGPEAAEWIERHVIGDVTDSLERVEKMDPDA